MGEMPTLYLAFAAGVLSFASPCILPLVPGYIGYMSGISGLSEARGPSVRSFLHAGAFVIGFGLVFTLFGLGVGLLGELLSQWQPVIRRVGGAVIVLMGLQIMGILRLPILQKEVRLETKLPLGIAYLSSFVLGLFFALGWTPCIGPVLTAILLIAASGQSALQATVLLASYSAGLGIPFLATGLFLSWATRLLKRINQFGEAVNYVSGALLIAMGLLLLTGNMERVIRMIPAWQLPL